MKKIVLDLDGFEGDKVSEVQRYIISELNKIKIYYEPVSLKKGNPIQFDLKFIETINTSSETISKIEIE